MHDRRQHERVSLFSTAVTTVLKEDSGIAPLDGFVLDISFGGARICATRSVEIGNETETVLKFINAKGELLQETVRGWVIWKSEKKPYYVFGVEFTGLNQKDQPGLLSYLEAQKSQKEELNLKDS